MVKTDALSAGERSFGSSCPETTISLSHTKRMSVTKFVATLAILLVAGCLPKGLGEETNLLVSKDSKSYPISIDSVYNFSARAIDDFYYSTTTNLVYFAATDDIHGRELWIHSPETSDVFLIDINQGPGESFPSFFFEIQGETPEVYFVTQGFPEFPQLGLVKAVSTTLDASTRVNVTAVVSEVRIREPPITSANNLIYFAGVNETTSEEFLYRFDPTKSILHTLVDAQTSNLRSIGSLVIFQENLFFAATDDLHGRELWKVSLANDNSAPELWDLVEGTDESHPFDLRVLRGRLVFAGVTGLYISDGTFEGTRRVNAEDLNSFNFPEFIEYQEDIYFTDGVRMWKVSNIENGELPVVTLIFNFEMQNGGRSAGDFFVYDDRLFFCVTDDVHSRELWVSDGTTNNTRLFYDINPGEGESSPSGFVEINGFLFFTTGSWDFDNGGLWVTNGTMNGTHLIKRGDVDRDSLLLTPRGLYFSENRDTWYVLSFLGDVARDSVSPSLAPPESTSPSSMPSIFGTPPSIVDPSNAPSLVPSSISGSPSDRPTFFPSLQPSSIPSITPTLNPSESPSLAPSSPSESPSLFPSLHPSTLPSDASPSESPSLVPSSLSESPSTISSSSSPDILSTVSMVFLLSGSFGVGYPF